MLDKYRAFEMNPGDAVQTDDEWLDFARMNGQTTYHVTGTCKMGSDPMAVVDDELRVHGIAGLRVIDASIMPTLVSGNTNAAVIMIAEKGADMIKEDAKVGLRAGRLTREIPVKPFMSCVAVLGLAIGLLACTTGSNPLSLDYKPESKENLLRIWGFKTLPLKTPAQIASFKGLPAHRLSQTTFKGKSVWIYPIAISAAASISALRPPTTPSSRGQAADDRYQGQSDVR